MSTRKRFPPLEKYPETVSDRALAVANAVLDLLFPRCVANVRTRVCRCGGMTSGMPYSLGVNFSRLKQQ